MCSQLRILRCLKRYPRFGVRRVSAAQDSSYYTIITSYTYIQVLECIINIALTPPSIRVPGWKIVLTYTPSTWYEWPNPVSSPL